MKQPQRLDVPQKKSREANFPRASGTERAEHQERHWESHKQKGVFLDGSTVFLYNVILDATTTPINTSSKHSFTDTPAISVFITQLCWTGGNNLNYLYFAQTICSNGSVWKGSSWWSNWWVRIPIAKNSMQDHLRSRIAQITENGKLFLIFL